MSYIVSTLRRDIVLRVLFWIVTSVILAITGFLFMLSLCVLVMPFISAEEHFARAVLVLVAHLLAITLPQRLLRTFSKTYGTSPPIHFTLSVIVWALTSNSGFFIALFALIQFALWAEVVGVYWKWKLA